LGSAFDNDRFAFEGDDIIACFLYDQDRRIDTWPLRLKSLRGRLKRAHKTRFVWEIVRGHGLAARSRPVSDPEDGRSRIKRNVYPSEIDRQILINFLRQL